MKQIKKIVLRDATKLTNSEMKSIRGGVIGEPPTEYSATCSIPCYHTTGAYIGSIDITCSPGNKDNYCDIVSGSAEVALACFYVPYQSNIPQQLSPELKCSDVYPNTIPVLVG